MKKLNKYTSLLVSAIIATTLIPSAAQASGKVHVNLVPSVIVTVDSYHQANNFHNKNSHHNKRNNHYSKNIYKTNYRANSNYNGKVAFKNKIVNTKKPFNRNSKTIIRTFR